MTEAGPSTPSAPTGDFASDPRIHFDQQSGKWAFEADDGTEMEWDLHRGAWVPVVSLTGTLFLSARHVGRTLCSTPFVLALLFGVVLLWCC